MPDSISIHQREFITQLAEFDAVFELVKAYDALPPIVDDNYPQCRSRYEGAMNRLLSAARANGRLPDMTKENLSFERLRVLGLSRCSRWHPGGVTDWSLSDWGVAAGGEMGEALNVIKKMNRDRDQIVGNTQTDAELRTSLAEEIADTVIYLDLLAARAGIDLAKAITAKFNKVSKKNGFPERL
jgi:NTP pyrophosphatase (non-canonical NTP hydrolase)